MSRLNDLMKWQRELTTEREELGKKLEPLLEQREQLRSKLELVTRLIAIEGGDVITPQLRSVQEEPQPRDIPTVASELQAAVHQVLEVNGSPMHISAINAALRQRGIAIPGRGTDANIIVHLRRAPYLFERKARGTYALVAWKKLRSPKLEAAG
jgi:hypothetical protein